MEKIKIDNIYLFLISIVPLTIVFGPSVSLVNILLIVLFFSITFKFLKINLKEKKIF